MVFIEQTESIIESLGLRNAVVVCDENTHQFCFPLLNTQIPCIIIPAGEENKNLETCSLVWDKLIEIGANRSTHLICLGGGVVTDLASYAASCFQRGMKFTLIPTSLLAMVDAAIGGKCGVDYNNLKNYIGLFVDPTETVLCSKFLETLPEIEIRNGLMEMLKHGLIADKNHYESVKNCLHTDFIIDSAIIQDSISIKLQHTEKDFFENGIRKRLNFGHTIGHAIESYALSQNKQVPHGLAVGVGMLAEAFLSHKYWSLTDVELQDISSVLAPLIHELPPSSLTSDELISFIVKDKKNRNNQVYFSLLNHIGSAQENIQINASQIEESLDFLKSLNDKN